MNSQVIEGKNDQLKKDVFKFWNSSPCGTYLADDLEPGTVAYFNKIDHLRYNVQPYKYDFIPTVAGFSESKGKTVLEIGCSVGTDLSQFAKNGAIVTGIDLTEEGIKLAKKRFEVLGLQGTLMTADAENLPFPDNSFDIVYSFGVLHHTPNTKHAINNEVFRVLKPGGKAVIGLYHKFSYNQLFLIIKAIRNPRLWKYSMFQRLNLLTEANKDPNSTIHNPLTKMYTCSEAKELFTNFTDVKTEVYWLNYWGWLPKFLYNFLDRHFGWYLMITATKK